MENKNEKLNFIEKILWFLEGMASSLFGLIIINELKYSDLKRHKEILSYLKPGVAVGIFFGSIICILRFINFAL